MEPYTLPFCNVIFNDKAEIPQEFEVTLPEYLPGIARILRADAEPFSLSSSLSDGQITVTGKYSVRLLYNDEKQGHVKCAVFPRDFSYTFDGTGMSDCIGTPVLEENGCILSVTAKPKSTRSLDISLGLSLSVTVSDCGNAPLLSPEGTDTELHAASVVCAVHKKLQADTVERQEDITLDSGMAPIADITDYSADFRLDDITCGDGNVHYRGNILFKCAYRAEMTAENAEAEYVYLTKELPFDGDIPCSDAHHGMNLFGKVRAEGTQVSSSFDAYGENRVIHVSLGYRIIADLLEETQVTYFDDGFCAAYECDFEKNTYTYDTLGQTVKEHGRFEQALRADREGFTEIADAAIRLDALTPEISDGKLYLNGRGILWVTGANEKSETIGTSAPIHVHLPVESVHEPSPEKRYVLTATCHNSQAVLRDGEIWFTCDTEVSGICFGHEKITALSRAEVHFDKPKPICHAEYIVYYPEKSENLWDIAKKYEIPRNTLRNANGFIGDTLPANKKTVVIPCGVSDSESEPVRLETH